MTPLQIVILVAGILGVQAIFWVLFLSWLRRKTEQMVAAVRAEVSAAGERIVRGPDRALYRGGTGPFPVVKGNGVAVLTDKRLIIRKIVGAGAEVSVDRIRAVREDKWFLRSYASGRPHVIVQTADGAELGFITAADHAGWMGDLQAKVSAAAA